MKVKGSIPLLKLTGNIVTQLEKYINKEIKKVLLAMTYSPRGSPPKYHRRWRA